MKQTTLIYVLVLVVGAAGLWAVLRVGNRLVAAADLGGAWTFDSGPLGPNADGPESLGDGFDLDQSGQFVRIRFASGRRLNLRARQMPRGVIGREPVELDLADDQWQLKGTLRQEEGKLVGTFRLIGPQRVRFVAYREPPTRDKPPPIDADLPPAPLPATRAATGDVASTAPAVALPAAHSRISNLEPTEP